MAVSNQISTDGNDRAQLKEPALDYLTVKGFRSIKSIEKLELRPLNVLIGANGSGKSNLLAVFSLLRDLRQGKLVEYADSRGGASKILHFGSKATQQIELEISFQIRKKRLLLSRPSPTSEDRFYIRNESCWYWNKKKYPSPYTENLTGDGKEAGISQPQQRTANPGTII